MATQSNQTSNQLKEVFKNGWPEVKADVSWDVQAYFPFREELITQNGLINKGERFVVPTSIRNTLLQRPTALTLESKIQDVEEEPAFVLANMARDIEQFLSKCEASTYMQTNKRKSQR